jgi:hypothetical protein
MRYVRILEIVLGLVFIVSAAGKAISPYQFAVQVSYYGVVTEPSLVQFLAYFMIVLETIFGVCLLAGIRWGGLIYVATVALLFGFSGLVVYAWSYRGLEDCGCFGELIQMGPKSTLAKNVVLIGIAVAAWSGLRRMKGASAEPEPVAPARTRTRYALAGAGALAVAIAAALGEGVPSTSLLPDIRTSDGPFGKFVFTSDMGEQIDLGTGDYLVIMLSATCEHCQAVSAILNEIMFMPDVPTTVGLLIADGPEELDEFNSIAQPMFITHVIDSLEWSHLIGKAPPRFYVIRDGHPLRHLDALEPTLEELYDFVVQPSEEGESSPPN